MTQADIEKAALALPADQRLALAEGLYRSITPEDSPPIRESERRILDDRLAEHARDPDDVVSWDAMRAEIWPGR